MMGAVIRRNSKARVVGIIKDEGGWTLAPHASAGVKDEINGLSVYF
jgi:hypothetical protein